jgi:hypothetical protein
MGVVCMARNPSSLATARYRSEHRSIRDVDPPPEREGPDGRHVVIDVDRLEELQEIVAEATLCFYVKASGRCVEQPDFSPPGSVDAHRVLEDFLQARVRVTSR